MGIVAVFDTPQHLGEYLKEERANSAKLIRESEIAALLSTVGWAKSSALSHRVGTAF